MSLTFLRSADDAARTWTLDTDDSRPVFCSRSLRSTQTSLSAALPPAEKMPTTRYFSLAPQTSSSPSPAPLNRFARFLLTTHSPLPGTSILPSRILKSGRRAGETASTPRMIRFVEPPPMRSMIGMFSSSSAASGRPCSSRAMPGIVAIFSAFVRSKPPLVSFDDPLRSTIRSSGSPETFRLCSSPSTSPKRMHDDQTIAPVPRIVSSVVTQRTRRFRTLYLSGIISSDPSENCSRSPHSALCFLPSVFGESRKQKAQGREDLKRIRPPS